MILFLKLTFYRLLTDRLYTKTSIYDPNTNLTTKVTTLCESILNFAFENEIMATEELLLRLRDQDRTAQKWLYERYSPLMFSVCKRYLRSREDAEEALVSGFFKVFSQVESYSGTGSFEGWVRRIMINECLMTLRKNQPLIFPGDEANIPDQTDGFNIESDISVREIIELLDQLPPGYRTVFNLYVLEGFKHIEIAETLGISINTSKSQLILAKGKLRNLMKTKGYF